MGVVHRDQAQRLYFLAKLLLQPCAIWQYQIDQAAQAATWSQECQCHFFMVVL